MEHVSSTGWTANRRLTLTRNHPVSSNPTRRVKRASQGLLVLSSHTKHKGFLGHSAHWAKLVACSVTSYEARGGGVCVLFQSVNQPANQPSKTNKIQRKRWFSFHWQAALRNVQIVFYGIRIYDVIYTPKQKSQCKSYVMCYI